ncbi:septation ring formation regulator EzrA [Staphylococcus aureus]|nr:septation ring formation regulator EzrA [Staphylococcus aureus]
MVLYIILAIIVIILIAVGVLFYLRSNKRQIIEKAIERKNEIETLPFDQNLAQLSKLNLKGETKTKYDAMKKDNVESTNKYLAPVEEKIHNAEALLDKFSFNASQSEIDDANELMDSYEQSYQQQLEDVNEIIALYKDNDELYDKCKVDYREMKRDVLANRHQFGEAASLLETEIEKFEPRLEQYEVLKADGNYVQAHNHIAALNEQMKQLRSYMEEIPELISRLELEEANDKLANINDKLDDMYDLIEHEVKAKNDVEETKDIITDNLFKAKDMNYTLQTEIEYVRENYYINESDAQSVRQFENEIQSLISVYDDILKEMSKSAVRYSEVQDNLQYLEDHVTVINDKQEKLQNHLIQLREDEAEAEDNLLRVQSKKEEVYRRLLASNLTSVPERFIIMKNEIDHEVRDVNEQFSERPIHVKQLKDKVSKIVIQMNTFEDEANDVLVNAVYAEKLIQYGNRYRKDYSNVDKSLNEAERLFKNNRYKRAIEIAEQALESVEPGVTKHIEEEVIKQ